MPLFRRTCVCLAALLYALPAFAQDREFRGPWEPFGPVPVTVLKWAKDVVTGPRMRLARSFVFSKKAT